MFHKQRYFLFNLGQNDYFVRSICQELFRLISSQYGILHSFIINFQMDFGHPTYQPTFYPLDWLNYLPSSNNFYFQTPYPQFNQINSLKSPQVLKQEVNQPQESQKADLKSKRKQKKGKKNCSSPKESQRNRNLSSLILKEFLKEAQTHPFEFFEVLQHHRIDYSVQKFLSRLKDHFSSNQSYIKPSTVKQLCMENRDEEFNTILRILLHYFLRKKYHRIILLKKKQRLNYLRECRVLYEKIFCEQ